MDISRSTRARTIIESLQVSLVVQEFRERYVNFDAAYEALVWSLARDCDKVTREVSERNGQIYNLFTQKKNEVNFAPRLRVLYTFDTDTVEIISLEVVLTVRRQ